ncbi:MAG: nuclear transport factor 2 family protein [Chloroflexi bacterium]|nr:nuclear transport factor 2 family protein [Chloroflexota bacterium]
MNKDDFTRYYEEYNNHGADGVSGFYTDDVIFEFQGNKLNGKEAVLKYFRQLHLVFTEIMKPQEIFVEGDKAAVEVKNEFVAKVDIPDFLGKSLKVGESTTARFGAFYDIRDGKIAHVRIYSL